MQKMGSVNELKNVGVKKENEVFFAYIRKN